MTTSIAEALKALEKISAHNKKIDDDYIRRGYRAKARGKMPTAKKKLSKQALEALYSGIVKQPTSQVNKGEIMIKRSMVDVKARLYKAASTLLEKKAAGYKKPMAKSNPHGKSNPYGKSNMPAANPKPKPKKMPNLKGRTADIGLLAGGAGAAMYASSGGSKGDKDNKKDKSK